MSKKPINTEPRMNRVWVELEKPTDKEHAEQVCALVNKMMERLVPPADKGQDRSKFFWNEHRRLYCYGGQMGYRDLVDHGEWFNLDYLGRAED